MIARREHMNPLWTDRRDGRSIRIFEPKSLHVGLPNVHLLSVLITKEYTRIDFQFDAFKNKSLVTSFVINERIHLETDADPSTYTPKKSYKLLNSENAPVEPAVFNAVRKGGPLYFTLYFEPLPLYTLNFSVIEERNLDKNSMNFHFINLDKGERTWNIQNSEN